MAINIVFRYFQFNEIYKRNHCLIQVYLFIQFYQLLYTKFIILPHFTILLGVHKRAPLKY